MMTATAAREAGLDLFSPAEASRNHEGIREIMTLHADIAIRGYRPEDLDGLIAIFTRAVRETASRDYTLEQVRAWALDAPDRDAWAARRASRPTFIAEIDGAMAGFSDLEPDGHIDMMFVSPDHGGRGVATILLAHIEAQARAAGLTRLFTEASLTARPFFARRGFAVIAEQQVVLRGEVLPNFRMEKHLAA
jgi:putative acetyltransferase